MSGRPPNSASASPASATNWLQVALRIAGAAWWLAPVFFLFWVYAEGRHAWFMADDFAWLSLLHRVQVRHDLWQELFAPAAQGTIRPWSERGFFISLEWLFGLDSRPFRVVAWATAAADLLLIAWIARRATGSRVAGSVAGILWAANTALVRAMTWSSAYNELMCPLFLLAALALFIRYIETGRRAFWWWQVVVFSLGFGVLEINVVYPALAAAWVGFCAPPSRGTKLLRGLLPLAALSVVYFAVHRAVAPFPVSGPYSVRVDGSMLKTLALYCKWTLVPEPMMRFGYHRRFAPWLVLFAGAAALAAFVVSELRRRRYSVLFFLSWFLITLAPVLPLPEHRTDYYLTIPVIGIAMLGGSAAGRWRSRSFPRRILVALPLAIYLWAMVTTSRAVTTWWVGKSLGVRTLVLGAVSARAAHPGKAIAVDGVTTELYEISLAHDPFRAVGIDDVYLTPESGLNIRPEDGSAVSDELVLDPAVLAHAVTHNDVVVYSLESDHLRNITEGYARRVVSRRDDRLPTRVDVGNILYSWLLGPMWLSPESGIRWMPGSAALRIGVPTAGGSRLELDGFCPEAQLLLAPRHLMVQVDGVAAGDTRIYDPESHFHRLLPMQALLAGKSEVEVQIRVDPVDRKDGQEYGMVFGKIAILP